MRDSSAFLQSMIDLGGLVLLVIVAVIIIVFVRVTTRRS